MKFYKCDSCGTVFPMENDGACCEGVTELVPNTTDAAGEKHVPVVTVEGSKVHVKVGSVEHPMLDAHYITFVVLETTAGFQKKNLKPSEKPVADFVLAEGEKAVAAYEYCNLHGLWKAEV